MTIQVDSQKYQAHLDSSFNKDLTTLFHRVWPTTCPSPHQKATYAHHPALKVQSFALYFEGRLISYTGIVQQTVTFKGEAFKIAGLSAVATDPDFQGQGWGSFIIARANEWLEKQETIDFGLFTCAPSLLPFYQQVGHWILAPHLRLIGNDEKKALTSDALDVQVLVSPYSEKAKKEKLPQQQGTINLHLPQGDFL